MSKQHLIYAASFDIGKKNFSFYIEEFDIISLSSLQNISKNERYNPNGTPTPKMEKLLKSVCNNGRTILFKNSDLTKDCEKNKYLDQEIYHNMTDLLDKYKEYWDLCSYFVVEMQMSFGKKHNTMALKLGQHCQAYFYIMYSRFKKVIEFPAFHKTQVLGAQKNENKNKKGKITYKAIDKPARKKWSIIKAKEIFAERKDEESLAMLNVRKADDLSDVLTQLQSFKYLMFVDKSI